MNKKIIVMKIEASWYNSPIEELEIFLNNNRDINIIAITQFLGSFTVIYTRGKKNDTK